MKQDNDKTKLSRYSAKRKCTQRYNTFKKLSPSHKYKKEISSFKSSKLFFYADFNENQIIQMPLNAE